MRITSSMMTKSYTINLNKSANEMNNLYDKVITGRKFSKGSEDPISAIKAYKLRRQYKATETYDTNIGDADSYLTMAETNLTQISSNCELVYTSYLKGITGTTASDDREIIAKQLDNLQESILTSLNAKIGDRYVFGGTSKDVIPFTVDSTTGELSYKGINVNDGSNKLNPPLTNAEGLAKLKELEFETMNVDLGLGMKFTGDELNKDTVFDMSMAGIKFMGYGTEAGMPKNLYSLIGEIKTQLRSDSFSVDNIKPYISGYETQKKQVLVNMTDLGSKTNYLDFLMARNESDQDSINKKILSVEYVDKPKAITDYEMQKYAYNAALAMGNKILEKSFIDFMS